MEYGEARTLRESSETLYCNFCGKSQREVAKLIVGPRVCVCNECVALIVQILNEPGKENTVEPLLVLKDFKPMPFHMPGAKLLEEVFGAEGPQGLSAMAMLAKLAVALQIRWERALGREGDLIAQLRELQGRENKLAPEVTGLREALETKELLLTEVREQIHTLQDELQA